MPNQTSTKHSTEPTHPDERRAKRRRLGSWMAIIIPVLFVAVLVAVSLGNEPPEAGTVAVDFELPSTSGEPVAFDADLPGRTLLYFSMGPGCDGCFAQIPEIQAGLDQRGIRLLPVMVDPVGAVAFEQTRFGITMPILIDEDRSVSNDYGMLGIYGHANRPSHSFAFVEDGEITWTRHYAEMFVPAQAFFEELDNA